MWTLPKFFTINPMNIGALVLAGLFVSLSGLGACPQARAQDQAGLVPLVKAHSHNDYMRKRPLLEALDAGFCSVEADIFLIDGELLVAHDLDKCKPENTLQRMYLDPLLERVRKNQGRVYPNGPEVTLLIDFKADGPATYTRLKEVLTPYEEMLTVFTPDSTETKAVTLIISGNSPRDMIAAEPKRLVSVDGRLSDLGGKANKHLMPMISNSWVEVFHWYGSGEMKPEEYKTLQEYITQAHANGQKIRFWAVPMTVTAWTLLYDAGLDVLNTDNIPKLQEFLLSRMKSAQ